MKIIVISPSDHLSGSHLDALRAEGELSVIKDIKPLEEIKELFEGDESRVVAIDPDFCDWIFPNDLVDKIPNLKAICLQTTSFSWMDVDHAKSKGIPVMNLRGFSSIAVAEWAVFMALAVARRVPIVIGDNWQLDYEKHRGQELRGKTAGVVGLGRIGTAVAENLAGLGMKVQYWSKNSEDNRFSKVSLDELMKTSDVILPALAKNEETKDIITDEMLRNMKSNALFVSIVHDVFNHELLLELAADEKIGGYAFETEKGQFGIYKGNVWNGPSVGWCTDESMSKNADQWVESIVKATRGDYPTQVN